MRPVVTVEIIVRSKRDIQDGLWRMSVLPTFIPLPTEIHAEEPCGPLEREIDDEHANGGVDEDIQEIRRAWVIVVIDRQQT